MSAKDSGIVEKGENPFQQKKLELTAEQREKISLEADKRIQKMISYMLFKESFFGNILLLLKRERTYDIPTMGVYYDNGFSMIYNPMFTIMLSDAHLYGVIKHELLHLILRHISRRKNIDDHMTWNVATDLSINSIIRDYIPSLGMFPDSEIFKELNLEWMQSADHYYEKLLTKEGQKAMEKLAGPKTCYVKVGKGKQGDGGENEVAVGGPTDVHDWERENGEGNEDDEEEILDAQIRSLLGEAFDKVKDSSEWGNLPDHVIADLKDFIFKKSELPWHVILKREVMFVKNVKTFPTRRKRNRRFGYAFPGKKTEEAIHVVTIFDTSGSVSDEDFLACCNELKSIKNTVDSLNVIHADIEPYDVGEFKDYDKIPPGRHGMGGTEFSPAIRFAEEKYNPDLIIYLTDGYASWDFIPSKKPIIWVITNEDVKVPKMHGKYVVLKRNGND